MKKPLLLLMLSCAGIAPLLGIAPTPVEPEANLLTITYYYLPG